MRIKSNIAQIACLTVLAISALLPHTPAWAETLPYYDVTANGTWDCRDPAGKFMGTIVLAEETYAFMKTDGRLGGYGKVHLLSFDTQMPNFALISGPLKDDFGAGGVGLTGPRDNYEEISGELFLTVAVTTDRTQSWYCTGRHAPSDLT